MSAANVNVVRTFYEKMEGGKLPDALALLAPDVQWTEAAGFPYAGTYHGPDAVRDNVFARFPGDWDSFAMDVDEILDAGDTIIGVGTYSGTGKATGNSMRARVVHVFRFRDGKIVGFEQFADTLKVREAVP